MTSSTLLGRRLTALRLERARTGQLEPERSPPASRPADFAQLAIERARRLAVAVDGELIQTESGRYIRIEPSGPDVPLDRARLAVLPGAPPSDVPLVCLDTETTGLATGPGTVAFLIGVGTWSDGRFQQMQLLLPDQADEVALLEALSAAIPAEAWLVSYNGRGFDWPLLVARYRMAGRAAPVHAGHLDLLPLVRRVFRHRLSDARLRTVETELLHLDRGPDIDGWEIPGRYLSCLRGGPADPLVEVVRHNHEDVRSLARLLAHAEQSLGALADRRAAPAGDLAGLAHAYRRIGRLEEALACIEAALEARSAARPARYSWTAVLTTRADAPEPTHPSRNTRDAQDARDARPPLLLERARLLRRLGRHEDAHAAWRDLATGGGSMAGIAWLEVAKVLEHRWRDPAAALGACTAAERIAERARRLGRPLIGIEADLVRRRRRLAGRMARAGSGGAS